MIFCFLLMTWISSLGAFFLKQSANKMTGIFSLLRFPGFYTGCCLYAMGSLLNIFLLRFMDYTVLYPMSAITYIWSLVISNRFLNEKITKKKLIGISLICLGVMLLI